MSHSFILSTMKSKFTRVQNESQSDFIQIARTINTGINYLPIPEPKLFPVQPRYSIDLKHQIEEDFSIRFRSFNEAELNDLLRSETTNFDRFKNSYQRLYSSVLQSLHHCVDLNEDLSRIKHQLTYENEVLPILIQNHTLAKEETKLLHQSASKSWRRFDERLDNEMRIQNQIEQLQQQRQTLVKRKTEQEYYQNLSIKLEVVQNEIQQLREEIRSFEDYKNRLNEQLVDVRSQRSYYLNQLQFLRSYFIRNYTSELENLQTQRDSLITQTELLKYNLFEQIQQTDSILHQYRTNLDVFRVTLTELEEQLRRQTDDGFQILQNDLIDFLSQTITSSISTLNSKDSPPTERRSTIHDDSQRLIFIIENQINEKQSRKDHLKKTIDEFEEKIVQQRKLIEKKEEDHSTMNQFEKKFHKKINRCFDELSQLKINRREIESQSHFLVKQIGDDDRLNRNLQQKYDSCVVRRNVEEQRLNTLMQRLQPLIEGNETLKIFIGQLQHQMNNIRQTNLFEFEEKLVRLRQTHQTHHDERKHLESTRRTFEKVDEQWKLKTSRLNVRLSKVVQRMKTDDRIHQENSLQIRSLENRLNIDQHRYLQWTFELTTSKNRFESQKTKIHQIEMQIEIKENQIKHYQHRLKNFDEQLLICHSDLNEQKVSLKKIREFHSVLNEQADLNIRKLSTGHLQLISIQYRCQSSMKTLDELNEQIKKSIHQREILAKMLVRRMSLCRLLYENLSRIEKQNQQRQNHLEMLSKCIRSLIVQIRNHQNQNKKLRQKCNDEKLKILRVHLDEINNRSNEKQIVLTRNIFQQRVQMIPSNPPTNENVHHLNKKYNRLKNRLIKIIYRGIICHLVLVSIQQDFAEHLNEYQSESKRNHRCHLNVTRANFNRLMNKLKAKTAETNMLSDYYSYFQFIRTDVLQQIIEWTNFIEFSTNN